MCILDEKISMKYIVDLTIQRYAFYLVLSLFANHFLQSSDFFRQLFHIFSILMQLKQKKSPSYQCETRRFLEKEGTPFYYCGVFLSNLRYPKRIC